MRSCGGCFGGVFVENGEVLMAAHITSNKAVKLVFARTILVAGVNLTAELASEPPRGGEHGAGEKLPVQKKIIRGIPKRIQIIACVSHKHGQN